MNWIRKIFNFYLDASIHVAFSVYAMANIVSLKLDFVAVDNLNWFLFFGTIVSYNFMKYGVEAKKYILVDTAYKRWIQLVSLLAFLGCVFLCFQLSKNTWLGILILLSITTLYILPFLPNQKSFRGLAGLKVLIVALVWAGTTVILPVVELKLELSFAVVLQFIQVYLMVLVLIIPFEIRDLKVDESYLRTLPQVFGVMGAKRIGYVLIVFLLIVENLLSTTLLTFLPISFILILMLYMSQVRSNRYFAAFWVEAVPMLWWLMWMGFKW